MFKSQLSGKQYDQGVSPVRIVTEVREVTYVNSKGKSTKGFEPVKEILVGPDEAMSVAPTVLIKSDKSVVEKRLRPLKNDYKR